MSNYCRCGANQTDGGLVQPPDNQQDTQSQWWQKCGECGKVSHAVQDVVRDVRCPVSTVAPLSTIGLRNGQVIHKWATGSLTSVETVEYVTYPRRVRVGSTEPLVFTVWELLMSKVAIILRPAAGPGDNALEAAARQQASHEGRGIAEALAVLMDPFVASGNDVVRHAVNKYRDPAYEVPGLGEHLWDPHTNPDGSPRISIAQPKTKTAARPKERPVVNNASTKRLTDEEAAGIKEAVGSGMFSKEEVASMFKVSLATVEAAVA